MRKALGILLLLACGLPFGCSEPKETDRVVDQCMRHEIFKECMASLPKGPEKTKYNDWDEVVDSCESAAYYQSLRSRAFVKAECRLER